MDEKLEKLKKIITGCESMLVAFSGGADSTLLLKIASVLLGEKVLAVTFSGEIHSPRDSLEAVELARLIGVRHLVEENRCLDNRDFVRNTPDRCYYCKKEEYGRLFEIAVKHGITVVADGLNADDLKDRRPGILAGEEMGVLSPLKDAGLTKEEIRAVSRKLNLPTADKPSSPCLASRFPYGTGITAGALRQVNTAEEILREMGVPQVRVRHYGNLARIEVPKEYAVMVVENAERVIRGFRDAGYTYVTLDLLGYRTGSLNEVLGK